MNMTVLQYFLIYDYNGGSYYYMYVLFINHVSVCVRNEVVMDTACVCDLSMFVNATTIQEFLVWQRYFF